MFSPCCAFPYVASQPPSFPSWNIQGQVQWPARNRSRSLVRVLQYRASPCQAVGQITCASPTSPSCHRIANTETASSLPLSHHAAQKHFLVLHCHHFITRPPNNVFVCRLAAIVPRKRSAAMICRSGLSKAHCQWTSHFLSAHEQPSNCYCYVVPHLQ